MVDTVLSSTKPVATNPLTPQRSPKPAKLKKSVPNSLYQNTFMPSIMYIMYSARAAIREIIPVPMPMPRYML